LGTASLKEIGITTFLKASSMFPIRLVMCCADY
jgi:hypothetical protein